MKRKKLAAAVILFSGILMLNGTLSALCPGFLKGSYTLDIQAAIFDGGILLSKTYEEKLKDAQDKKKKLEEDKRKTQQSLDTLKKEQNEILDYIKKLDLQLNDINLRIAELDADIEKTEAELIVTQEELEEAKKTETEQYEIMKRRIQYMYENGSTGYLEILFNSGSISDILNQFEYFSKITEYDNNLLDRYTQTKLLVADKEACLEVDLQKYNDLKEAAAFDRETTQTLIKDKSAKIEEYTQKIGITDELLFTYGEELTKQEGEIESIKEEEERRIQEEERKRKAEEARLRKEAEERKRQEEEDRKNNESNVNTSDEKAPENMIWPLPGDGRIFSYFGYRKAPTAGASTYHRGLDIGGEMGASIVASLAGTVEISTYSVTSGNYVILNHGNGLRTAYLHCSKLLVSVGDYVQQGEVVGLVGSTGVSTGPHLHFGVSVNGTYVDPINYISYN